MARIIGVTFETECHARPGHFSVPRDVARFLGVKDGDPVEISVLHEGLKLELALELRSGLEVYHRAGDPSTSGLEQLPAKAPITVTVWRSGEDSTVQVVGNRESGAPWTPEQFDRRLLELRGPAVVDRAAKVRSWAVSQGLRIWWGRGIEWGGWIPVIDLPSGGSYQLFELWTSGSLSVQFVYIKKHSAFAEADKREELRHRLNLVEGISLPADSIDRQRSFQLADLPDDEALNDVLRAFDWVVEEIRTAA